LIAQEKENIMNKIKMILTVALTFVVLFAQVGNVAATPLAQDPALITGTITDITLETDTNGVATAVLVTLEDDLGATQTVRISVETAALLGLLVLDVNGQPVLDPNTGLPDVDEDMFGTIVEIAAIDVIPDEGTEEEPVHPIATLLAAFFGAEDENLASVIDGYHTDGYGFGVIAQALWMSQNITGTEDEAGDASLAGEILDAKKNKDFAFFFEAHPEYFEGDVAPTNWGQFRKALLNKKQNLGVVVSGQADLTEQESSNSNGNDHGNGNGNNGGNSNRNNNGNGKGPGNNNSQNKNK
jgi:hypothetical protein